MTPDQKKRAQLIALRELRQTLKDKAIENAEHIILKSIQTSKFEDEIIQDSKIKLSEEQRTEARQLALQSMRKAQMRQEQKDREKK